ncbi:MAG TPA: hypothetical protein VF612_03690 [Jatrophihabitans sp.]|jgi:hypothetical protein|uniref:hypothetical protein n=1 Tax=Jatrophihabitans sp. TaxID=1932789 RepID=UPI002F1AF539
MGRDDAYADDIDWLDVSSADGVGGTAPPRRPWPRWLTLAVTGVVIAVVVAVLNLERRDPAASTARPAPASSTPLAPAAAQPPLAAVSVTELGRPLLNTTAKWELFGRGPGVLVRIEPAAGRITRTVIPDLRSGGAVYLVAGSDRVVIRPLDHVPGYLVRDGRPAEEMSPLLNVNGPVFPGPSPDRMWVRPADDHQPVMALTTLDGQRLPQYIPVPAGNSSFEAVADGGGYLLYTGIGGVYDARPGGVRRISTGALMAVGPTGWLAVECDERYRCRTVSISRANGQRRTVAEGALSRDWRGVISPDGSTAAVTTAGPNGVVGLSLIDLVHNRVRRLPNQLVNQDALNGAMVFSPDSAWLFTVAPAGTVSVINPRTAAVSPLGISLPGLSQLVVRPAPRARPASTVAATSLSAAKALAVAQALTKTCCRPTPRP